MTVRHLLTHTSGIREQQWKDGIIEFDRFEHDQEEIVKTAFGPMLAKPGDKLTVIVLSNCETGDTGRIGLGVVGFYVPALLSPEVKRQR